MKNLLRLVVMALIAVTGWAFSDLLPLGSEVTVYSGFCPTPLKDGKCAAGEEAASFTTYRIIPEVQSVVFWSENGAPSKFDNCAIRDRTNWSCSTRSAGGAANNQIVDGRYSEVVEMSGMYVGSPFYQLRKWRWHLLRWQISKA